MPPCVSGYVSVCSLYALFHVPESVSAVLSMVPVLL